MNESELDWTWVFNPPSEGLKVLVTDGEDISTARYVNGEWVDRCDGMIIIIAWADIPVLPSYYQYQDQFRLTL